MKKTYSSSKILILPFEIRYKNGKKKDKSIFCELNSVGTFSVRHIDSDRSISLRILGPCNRVRSHSDINLGFINEAWLSRERMTDVLSLYGSLKEAQLK